MADKRDPRHEAGQQHIDHLMSRYSSARDAKKAGKEYDKSDIENVKKAGLMTSQEIEKDFPKPGLMQRLKDNVMGTKAQNEEATERMRKMDEKNPDSTQAKVNKALGMKSGGKVSSASKRADGCAIKGKTKGRMV
jgi:predicted Zn-dependent protease